MISFRVSSYQFHLRAAAIVLESEYILLHRLELDTFWALPGGRVDAGEDGALTIAREFVEELGAEVHCNGLVCIGENFFEFQGQPHHEVGMYFSVSLPAASDLRDTTRVHIGVEGDKRLEFRWFPCGVLRNMDFRPKALREPLADGKVPMQFVQRG